MAQAEAPCTFQTTLDGQPPNEQRGRPMPKDTKQNSHRFCLCV